jgi:hypothetical protein
VRRAAALLVVAAALAAGAVSAPRTAQASPSVLAYSGLGTWIDIYPPLSPWLNPKRTIATALDHGVKTLYIETSNYNTVPAIRYPMRLAELIDQAHANNIKVVGWYLPSLLHTGLDLHRIQASVAFRTPRGGALDSMAVDIESSAVPSPALRSARLLQLAAWLRASVGPSYPLGAIIPSPRGMQLSPSYWPGFPFSSLAQSFDVVLPMDYATYHRDTPAGVVTYERTSLRILAHQMESAPLPIHAIGGLAPDSGKWMTWAFVQTALAQGVIGAGLYDLPTTRPGAWWALEHVH